MAIARGEMEPARVLVPSSVDVRAIRKARKMTQAAFADAFGFTLAQLRDWEQGRATPNHAAPAYLLLIPREPEAVRRALAAA